MIVLQKWRMKNISTISCTYSNHTVNIHLITNNHLTEIVKTIVSKICSYNTQCALITCVDELLVKMMNQNSYGYSMSKKILKIV